MFAWVRSEDWIPSDATINLAWSWVLSDTVKEANEPGVLEDQGLVVTSDGKLYEFSDGNAMDVTVCEEKISTLFPALEYSTNLSNKDD